MSNFSLAVIRKSEPAVVVIGSHRQIVQSILDFDFLLGRPKPTVKAIVAAGRRSERYFYGENEVLLPVYSSAETLPESLRSKLNYFINVQSGRRVLSSTKSLLGTAPNLIGGTVFAERFPEQHALELADIATKRNSWIAGAASVGVIVPGHLKLSAIGGVDARQLDQSRVFEEGQIAVVSSSGGMVNELIRMVAGSGQGVSFAVALGGERYPMLTADDVFLAAEADSATKAIAYFGELGGDDEYRIVELVRSGKVTKPIVAYIAGTVSELFETPPQFGHAKALAASDRETASAKRQAMRAVGIKAADSFGEFIAEVTEGLALLPVNRHAVDMTQLNNRKSALFASSVSYDVDGDVRLMGKPLLDYVENRSFAEITISLLLGRDAKSKELIAFTDFVLRLLVDHGPYVSGAVNTMVSARAGKDMVSALASGLLTIGPRFGGAINQAASTFHEGVNGDIAPAALVEQYAARKQYISGIGHKKYRVDTPDPRVKKLLALTAKLKNRAYTKYALAVEHETIQKKGNLILNVDGVIAAGLLDILAEKEGYGQDELKRLIDAEFFNALFVLSRSVGFMAHYFDQVRLDEGLFRLSEEQILPFDRD